ncbi:response regulator [uncultured Ruegeria sp.]|uniref:response regulator n=1 Tax=uncultured Ruegeria sp. TaxID=259304 RepID=UPI00262C9989|nr:response regulator [uncultured Ruegeria sp.]
MTDTNIRLMVCDDETHLREMVGEYFTDRGYLVTEAEGAKAMRKSLAIAPVDLIVLDVNMPGEDGLTALRELRRDYDIPVIMLTAASEVIDRVIGLEMGANDYIAKPVDLRELEARVKAALRGWGITQAARTLEKASPGRRGVVALGNCRLDMDSARLFGPDGNEMAMTAMEFDLLRVFVENRGRVLNRNQLLEQAHDRGWEAFDRSIDLRISRLRRKIEANPTKPEVIRTVRGVGYMLG